VITPSPLAEDVSTGDRSPDHHLRRPNWLARRYHELVRLVFPPVCAACHQPMASEQSLCAPCWQAVTFIRPPLCDRLGIPLPFDTGGRMISGAAAADPPDYARARAVAAYTGTMRELVHCLKFEDRLELRCLMGQWLVLAGAELLARRDTVLVPVPTTRLGLLRRRFNQAALLAGEVARRTMLEVRPAALVRRKQTRSQVGLSRAERRRNVAGAFAVPARQAPSVRGRPVVLIDDVITTGATARAAARALLAAGAERVDVLALAIVTDAHSLPA
jgi:ComF family protein